MSGRDCTCEVCELATELAEERMLSQSLRAEVERLQQRISEADAYLADPSGHPIDAINLARAALAGSGAGT